MNADRKGEWEEGIQEHRYKGRLERRQVGRMMGRKKAGHVTVSSTTCSSPDLAS